MCVCECSRVCVHVLCIHTTYNLCCAFYVTVFVLSKKRPDEQGKKLIMKRFVRLEWVIDRCSRVKLDATVCIGPITRLQFNQIPAKERERDIKKSNEPRECRAFHFRFICSLIYHLWCIWFINELAIQHRFDSRAAKPFKKYVYAHTHTHLLVPKWVSAKESELKCKRMLDKDGTERAPSIQTKEKINKKKKKK